MLQLTNYQIFFMVLHGCLLFFAISYLLRGKSPQQKSKVISYREFQRQKQRQQNRQRAKVSTIHSHQSVAFRDVYEVAVGGEPALPSPTKTRTVSTALMISASDEKTLTAIAMDAEITQKIEIEDF